MADVPRAWAARIRDERRARGWDKPEMARHLALAAGAGRASLPSSDSLLTYVKRWERGATGISERYRMLYASALGVPEDDLFGPDGAGDEVLTPDDEERLIFVSRRPSRLDTPAIDSLAAILSAQRRTEDTIGSGPMLDAATAHLRLLLRLLKDARGPLATRVAATASDASQFVGWLNTATSRHDVAGPIYDQSLRLGLQAGDSELSATALSMRGHLAWVTGDFGGMAGLSRAARGMAASSATRATAAQQEGRALALVGDRQGALRAIGQAEEELAAPADADDPDLLYFSGPALLQAQRGLILAFLASSPSEHAEAADTISSGVNALPPAIRDSEWLAWYRVQASRARALSGEVGEGAAGLRVALDIVSATGGEKTRTEIAEVQTALAGRWPDDPAVAELGEALR